MSKNKHYQSDIIISGGGVAGLTLALLLAKQKMTVHLIEPFPPPEPEQTKPSGRTVALMQSSLEIIKTTGIWNKIEPLAAPLEIMRIIDDSIIDDTPVKTDFPAYDIGMDAFGMNIPNGKLRALLFEKAKKQKNITLHIAKKLDGYKAQGSEITAKLDDGGIITAPLIIGADGRNSLVRKIAGIKTFKHDYKQSAITCLINHSKTHNNTSTEFHRPSGPLALVPLPANQSSIVWVNPTKQAENLLRLDKQSFINALQDKTLNILGGITLETPPECWPLISIKAKKLTAPRIALVAEAAHVISPITAQGLNLSLRDVAALAECITEAWQLGLDLGSKAILSEYERNRRLDIGTRVHGVNSLNALVSNNITPIKSIRRAGLRFLDHTPFLKKKMMRRILAPDSYPPDFTTRANVKI